MNWALLLILGTVCLGAMGEVLFKVGVQQIGSLNIGDVSHLPLNILRIASNPVILIGFACYGLGWILWIFALSNLDLSYAHPLYAMIYVLVPLAAYILLKEEIPLGRWAGIGVIMAGVAIVFYYGPKG